MTRLPKASDFTVDVDGVGTFTFGRRTWADELAIQVEYARILGGVPPTMLLDRMATWTAVLKTLIVRAPEGFDFETIDPLEMEDYTKVSRVFDALNEKENSFRRKPAQGGEGSGAAAA
jgi:hypothetical protein